MSLVRTLAVALLAAAALAGVARADRNVTEAQLDFVWSRVPVADGSPTPGPRKDAAVGYDVDRDRLILFGGKPFNDETWAFTFSDNTWTRLAEGGPAPEPRFSMVWGMDRPRDRFLITTGEGPGKVHYNDVWAFDLTTDTWSEVATSGTPPSKRYGSGGGTYVFGGDHLFVTHGFRSSRFDDTFVLRLSDDTWSSVTPSSCPFARCLVGAAVHKNNRLTMYGGCGSGGYGPCPARDVWTLDTQADATSPPSRDTSVWREQDGCPGPKMFTAMTLAPGQPEGTDEVRRLLLFGGDGAIHGSGGAGDVGVFHLGTGDWDLLSPGGAERPSVRKQSNLVYIHSNPAQTSASDSVIVLGGSSGGDEMWRLSLAGAAPPTVVRRDCPYYFDLRLFHGLTMFLSWGLLLPIGIFAARFGRHYPNALWFKIHRPVQMLGVVLQTAGFIAIVLDVPVGAFSYQPHSAIGAFVFIVGILQPVNAFFRPHKEAGSEPTRGRVWWERIHLWSGRVALVLGMLNPFGGFQAIGAHSAVVTAYTVWFATYWAAYIGLSLAGEPVRSPAAQVLNEKLLCGKGRLNLGGKITKEQDDSDDAVAMESNEKE